MRTMYGTAKSVVAIASLSAITTTYAFIPIIPDAKPSSALHVLQEPTHNNNGVHVPNRNTPPDLTDEMLLEDMSRQMKDMNEQMEEWSKLYPRESSSQQAGSSYVFAGKKDYKVQAWYNAPEDISTDVSKTMDLSAAAAPVEKETSPEVEELEPTELVAEIQTSTPIEEMEPTELLAELESLAASMEQAEAVDLTVAEETIPTVDDAEIMAEREAAAATMEQAEATDLSAEVVTVEEETIPTVEEVIPTVEEAEITAEMEASATEAVDLSAAPTEEEIPAETEAIEVEHEPTAAMLVEETEAVPEEQDTEERAKQQMTAEHEEIYFQQDIPLNDEFVTGKKFQVGNYRETLRQQEQEETSSWDTQEETRATNLRLAERLKDAHSTIKELTAENAQLKTMQSQHDKDITEIRAKLTLQDEKFAQERQEAKEELESVRAEGTRALATAKEEADELLTKSTKDLQAKLDAAESLVTKLELTMQKANEKLVYLTTEPPEASPSVVPQDDVPAAAAVEQQQLEQKSGVRKSIKKTFGVVKGAIGSVLPFKRGYSIEDFDEVVEMNNNHQQVDEEEPKLEA